MAEKGVLFQGEMVRALLNTKPGAWPAEPIDPEKPWKWQTRRLPDAKQMSAWEAHGALDDEGWPLYEDDQGDWHAVAPRYDVGDVLWVRETLREAQGDTDKGWIYAADGKPVMVAEEDATAMITWAHHKQQDYCPSIFMPRWASRITLEVMEVRCDRLHDITEADALAEGMDWNEIDLTARDRFSALWEQINGNGSWDENPWVFVCSFRRLK